MTTMNHQYLATWFYDYETIEDTLSKNTIHETNEIICQWIDGKISDDQLTDVLLSLCKRIIYEQNEELQSNSA